MPDLEFQLRTTSGVFKKISIAFRKFIFWISLVTICYDVDVRGAICWPGFELKPEYDDDFPVFIILETSKDFFNDFHINVKECMYMW